MYYDSNNNSNNTALLAANAINRTREPTAGYGTDGRCGGKRRKKEKDQLTTSRQNFWSAGWRDIRGGAAPPTIEAAAARVVGGL